MKKTNKAIILGAASTGLVTAWKLLESNRDVTVIEKQNISGRFEDTNQLFIGLKEYDCKVTTKDSENGQKKYLI